MKKILKNFTALALGLTLVAAGCSKDDEPTGGIAKEVVGNYVGDILLSDALVAPDITVPVTEVDETNVLLALNTELHDLPMVGDLPLNVSCKAAVAKSGENYTLTGSNEVAIPALGEGLFPLSIVGTVTPAGAATFTISITITGMPVPVVVVFTGARQ
jgi:hypothetical protein